MKTVEEVARKICMGLNLDAPVITCYAFYVVILHYTGEFNEIGHLSGRGPSFGVAV